MTLAIGINYRYSTQRGLKEKYRPQENPYKISIIYDQALRPKNILLETKESFQERKDMSERLWKLLG